MSEEKPSLKIEVFSAGCPLCRAKVQQARVSAGPEADVRVFDMHSEDGAHRAALYGITQVPAVVVGSRLVVEGAYSDDDLPEKGGKK